MSAPKSRPGPALKPHPTMPVAEEIHNKGEQFSLKEVFKNPDAYEFRCESILIIPDLRLHEKSTGKLMSKLGNMRIVKHEGTMNQEYADKFFADIRKETMPTFLRQVSESLKQQQAK